MTGSGALERNTYWMISHLSIVSISGLQGSVVFENCFIVTESKNAHGLNPAYTAQQLRGVTV